MIKTEGGFLISQIKQIGGRIFDKILNNEGIDAFNGAQGKILYSLWENDGISSAQLAALTGLAPTTLTSMLDRMEASGLLVKAATAKDRRKLSIVLTPYARSLKEQFDSVSEKTNQVFYRGFTDTEIQDFEDKLRRIVKNLSEEE